MKIAFKKCDGSISSKLICWWTKSPYSHCELVFSNGLSFIADMTRYRTYFINREYNTDEWHVVDIKITREEECIIYNWALEEDGCLYDIIGLIFTQIIPLSFQNSRWWFCSELCVAALQQVNILTEIVSWQTDPGELFNKIHLLERIYE